MFLIELIFKLLDLYTFIIFIRVILSWVHLDPSHPLVQLVYSLTEPVLRPLRLLINLGNMGFDLSPILALFLYRWF